MADARERPEHDGDAIMAFPGGPARGVAVLGTRDSLSWHAAGQLAAAGHLITVVRTARAGRRPGATGPIRVAEANSQDELVSILRNHEVICNLVPVMDEPAGTFGYTVRRRGRRPRSRLLAAVSAALESRPRARLVQRSCTAIYDDAGGSRVTETSPIAPNDATWLAAEAERIAAGHASRGGVGLVLRFGRLYGPGDAWTKQRLALARRGWRALEGPDEAYFPTIHVDDAARAVAAAISVPSGIYNVTDSVPLTNGQLNAVLASLSGRPRLYPLWPSFHPADRELLARSHRVDSGLFEQSSGWKPLMPSAETGLPSCVPGRPAP